MLKMNSENIIKDRNRNINVAVVTFFMVFCYVGYLAQFTIMSQYIYHRISVDNKNGGHSNISQCYTNNTNQSSIQSKIQGEVAQYNIYAQLSSGIPSMIAVVIYGILSDIYGRKRIIMISWLGLFTGTIFNIFLIGFNGPLWIYIFAQFLTGIGGNYGAMLTGVLSIISDSTSKKTRNFGIIIIEFSLGISMVISQALLGLWLNSKDFVGPIVTFGIIFSISGILLCFIKETKINNQIPTGFSLKFHIYISVVKMLKVFYINSKFNFPLMIALFAFVLHTFNFFGHLSLITLYLFGRPFCWAADVLGYYRSVSALIIQLGMFLSLFLIKCQMNEILIIEIGFMTNIMSKLLFSIAPSFSKHIADYIIYTASLDLFSGASVSLLRSISSKLISPDEYGLLFGVMSSLETFSSLTGGVIFNLIYEWSFIFYYGISYIFSAFLLFVAFVLMIIFNYIRYTSSKNNYAAL